MKTPALVAARYADTATTPDRDTEAGRGLWTGLRFLRGLDEVTTLASKNVFTSHIVYTPATTYLFIQPTFWGWPLCLVYVEHFVSMPHTFPFTLPSL